MRSYGRASEAGAIALVLVSVSFFVFMMFKVPLYGAYKLTSATFGIFKTAWWLIFGILAILGFMSSEDAVVEVSAQRGDRRRPKARKA